LKLLIVGSGSLDKELKKLTKELEISSKTIFTGNIPFSEVPKYHNMLSVSVSVSVSNSESFGVAIIEASSCAKPVVVSNIGGLPEVVEDGVSGFVVDARNPQKTADAIEKLILDEELRINIGNNGRDRVKRLYSWDDSVRQMINIYKDILK
jgi:glycosyltransferase involved in cell wall biosynthesis